MSRDALEAFYALLWPLHADPSQPGLLATLDEDPGGRSIDSLYELAGELGLGATSEVLDAGCGRGHHTARLAARFGCRVVALDPLGNNLAHTAACAAKEAVADRVRGLEGSFEAIPAADGSFDFIWCRESLNHTTDLPRAFEEMARVLRPAGRILIYSAVATELLHPEELPTFCDALAINPATLAAPAVEAAMARAGLVARLKSSTSDEHSPYREALTENEGRDVLVLARLRRARDRCVRAFGEGSYGVLVALYTWRAYWTIRKLEQVVWVAQKPAAGAPDATPR